MNTQHLQYIIEIERTRSISQAAENLFIGQPNLSRKHHTRYWRRQRAI